MSNNKELEELFKHIQIGLSKYTVKELNEAIISFISKKNDKSVEVDYVFKIVCEDFNITEDKIKQKNIRGTYYDAKQIIYCILHFNLGISIRNIAKYIFSNNHMSVYSGIKRFNTVDINLKQDKLFLEKYNKLSQKFLEYFTIKQNELV
jgi:chromosomal replication initiation ATPase DnaA